MREKHVNKAFIIKKNILVDIIGPANNKIGTLIHVVSCKYMAVERCFVKYVKYRLGNL